MIIWMFSLDHMHHERSMLVFIEDLLDLPFMHEKIRYFSKGCFAVKETKKKFSNIEIDQTIS